jgi:hypothetical protein
MKKLFITLILACAAVPAMAQHYHGHGIRHHGHHWRHNGSGNWIPVLISGAIVGAAIANSKEPVVVQPQPTIVYQNPPVYVQRQTICTEWKEIQNPDGTIYRERTCTN